MIITKITGGLGNQLFQYAAGRRLALKHKTELKLDISFLDYAAKKYPYYLCFFNIKATMVTDAERNLAGAIDSNSGGQLLCTTEQDSNGKPFYFYGEKSVTFEPNVSDLPDNLYLRGHWQTEKYFEDIKNVICDEIVVNTPQTGPNAEMAKKIKATNSVSVHIRRTDYVSTRTYRNIYNVCDLEYYKLAVDYISKRVDDPTFFVFSDDIPWAKTNMHFPYKMVFVDINDMGTGYEDLRLMSQCKHNIIANSTFSWWGAWLNKNPKKIVVAPHQWFGIVDINTKDIVPSSWIKIAKKKKLLLYSRLALYPMHWEAFKIICKEHNTIEPVVLTVDYAYDNLPDAHKMLSWGNPEKETTKDFKPKIYYIPQTNIFRKVFLIVKYLREISPDIIWSQEEPSTSFIFPMMLYYHFNKKPKIVGAVNENIFIFGRLKTFLFKILWKRFDGLLSTTKVSLDGIIKAGMPLTIPASVLVCGCLSPVGNEAPMKIPIRTDHDDFVIGFVGRIIEEKGWKVIIRALKTLPNNFKLAVVGNGNQIEEFKKILNGQELKNRIWYSGFIPKNKLWGFYKGLDCLAVPSLTIKTWKEQTGGVLQDAMSVGLPIIGSDSGGIPEIVGDSGIIVPENDHVALAKAIKELKDKPDLRKKYGNNGKKRFEKYLAFHRTPKESLRVSV